jgi:hypothetical protein
MAIDKQFGREYVDEHNIAFFPILPSNESLNGEKLAFYILSLLVYLLGLSQKS